MKKKGTNLTQEQFEQIKTLINIAGLSHNKIGSIVGRSGSTVRQIAKYNTLEEYREANRLSRASYYKKAPAETVEETTKAGDIIPISEFNEYKLPELERMAIALERLADAWENSPSKKGWLK